MDPPHPYWADHAHSDEHVNVIFTLLPRAMDPPHPYWTDRDHDHEHLNLMYTTVHQQHSHSHSPSPSIPPYQQDMNPPYPYWLDHNHSDEHLNLIYTTHSQETDPPHPYWTGHDHNHSDEHLNSMYTTVRQQHSHSHSHPPSPDPSHFNPHLRAQRKLRVINTTPTPPSTPPLFAEEDENQNPPAWQAEERSLSSTWSSSEEISDSSLNPASEEKISVKHLQKNSNNFLSKGFRKASYCLGKAVLAARVKISPISLGNGKDCKVGGVGGGKGEGGGKGVGGGSKGFEGEGLRVRVLKKVKRTLLCKMEPGRLTPAKVRFPLD